MISATIALSSSANANNALSSHLDVLTAPALTSTAGFHNNPIMKSAPVGERKTYTRSASYFYILLGVSITTSENYATDIIFSSNDEVYIKAPLSDDKMPSDVFMKGSIKDNVITVSFPQDFANIGGVNYTLNRLEYKITNPDEQKGMYFIADKNEITYSVNSDGSVEMEKSNQFSDEIDLPDFILGLTDPDGNWVGYGDFNQLYAPFDKTITTMPADAEVRKMLIRYDGYAAKVMDMGTKDDKVYIAGFNTYCPEACITGTVDGDKLSFDAGQYLGVDNDWNSFAYLWAVKYEMGPDKFTGDIRLQMVPVSTLDFTWDSGKKTFSTENTLVVNLGNEDLAYIELYKEICGAPYVPNTTPAAPMPPVFDVVNEYNPDENYKYGNVRFLLPMLDVNGNLLDTSKLYYNFLIDGVPYEFKTAEYEELKQNMIEIPWGFTDTDSYGGYDFKAHNITHIVYFYDPSMKMLDHMALQQFYKQDDNTVLASEVTYYGKPSALDNIETEYTETDAEYFNLQGMPVDKPANGIFLKVVKCSDGSVRTTKVAIR